MENDKFEIPEEYKNMSVDKLRELRNELYDKLAKNKKSGVKLIDELEMLSPGDADKARIFFKYDYLSNVGGNDEIN